MAEVEEPMVALLLADAAVAAIVSTRIAPIKRDQSWGTAAAITYRRIARAWAVETLSGPPSLAHPTVEVVCWAPSLPTVRTLARAVQDALDDWRNTAATPPIYDTIPGDHWIEDADGDGDDRVFYVEQQFDIWTS